jgi:hypothetical protein
MGNQRNIFGREFGGRLACIKVRLGRSVHLGFSLASLGLVTSLRLGNRLFVKELTQLLKEVLSLLLVETLDECPQSQNLGISVCHLGVNG